MNKLFRGTHGIAIVCASASLSFGQSVKELTVCEVVRQRHQLSKAGLIRVAGIDMGDGALRDPCSETIDVHGVRRPAALWIVEAAEAEATVAQQERLAGSMSLSQYVDLVAKLGREKRRQKGRNIVLIGYLQTKAEDAAISAGSPRKRYAGFGRFGIYPVQIAVVLVEVNKVTD